jgi:hypothetical protein
MGHDIHPLVASQSTTCIISSIKKLTHHFHSAIEGGLGGGLD